MKEEYKIGHTGYYIQDYPFSHLCPIPTEAAVEWARKACPDVNMGSGTLAKDLTIGGGIDTDALGNGWHNKLFVVVANGHGRWIAIANWDGGFSVWTKTL